MGCHPGGSGPEKFFGVPYQGTNRTDSIRSVQIRGVWAILINIFCVFAKKTLLLKCVFHYHKIFVGSHFLVPDDHQ